MPKSQEYITQMIDSRIIWDYSSVYRLGNQINQEINDWKCHDGI